MSVSRRQALAGIAVAAAVVPVATTVTVAEAFAVTDRAAWDAAMSKWQSIKAQGVEADKRFDRAADAFADLTGHHPFKGKPVRPIDPVAGRLSGFIQAEHVAEELAQREHEANDALLVMPAPDGEALLWKLDELFGDVGEGSYSASWCAEYVDAFMSDARRLLTIGRA